MLKIGVLIYYNSFIYGNTKYNDHLLVIDMFDNYNDTNINNAIELINNEIIMIDYIFGATNNVHKTIRNYMNIIQERIPQIQIFETYTGNSGEILAIDKTYILRIFQRKIKIYLKYKNMIYSRRKNIKELRLRSIYGKWSYKCTI